jgi:predicted naringenin-chalcone synthase
MTVTKEVTTKKDGTKNIKETIIHPDGRKEVKTYTAELGGSKSGHKKLKKPKKNEEYGNWGSYDDDDLNFGDFDM